MFYWSVFVIFLNLVVLNGQYQPYDPFQPFSPSKPVYPASELDTSDPDLNLERNSRCYDEAGIPQKCVPEFVNAAFGRRVEASNTCGIARRQEYCLQTGYGSRKSCEICDAYVRELSHPADLLTDFNNNDNQTWWQSETMFDMENVSYPINITLNLGKAFDITYIRLFFHSPRPESFAIYKRSSPESDWVPYQFYSASCRGRYIMPDSTYVPVDDETRAVCTSEFSDISPLTGGNVAFSTLEYRPSAYNFEKSPQLQEWVTATDIMIVLDNLNTFGDEVFGDPQVLKSYFYAITDLAVGGRCKCNGHASECVDSTGYGDQPAKVCVCEHNTMGTECEKCLSFYNDAPWKRATSENAYECRPCNCNGFSSRCYFDEQLYERTGHGGHCTDCSNNRAGPNCERCRDNYYEREDGACVACNCNEVGSRTLQCGNDGLCQCKPGVVGDKCDRCEENHYDFSPQGCKPCGCFSPGSYDNRPRCNPLNGVCSCKAHVEGQQCDTCKPGYFNLDGNNRFGCTPCFCYGHSSICSSAPGYSKGSIESTFVRGEERWKAWESSRDARLEFDSNEKHIGVSARGREPVYFSAPSRFLGNQRSSYNHDISFTLRIGELGPQSGPMDIILEGAGLTVSTTIFAQDNSLPSTEEQEYRFTLHENGDFGWSPRLTSINFMSLLSNLTAIKIRGTFAYDGTGYLDNVKLETARPGQFGDPATWVETCTCPEGYVGQFCESCGPGYRHSPPNGGPFATCIPCDCNNHADICDSETGQCICQHNTEGNQCDRCARGYYGNALQGTPDDCQPCPCPNGGACITLADEKVVCMECPDGYIGPRCELCTDGYFGDPQGRQGAPRPCEKCDCNGNIDSNAVSNCNRTTGECLKCIYNTGGFYCDQCLPGFYGDALALPKGDCRPCRCNYYGTVEETYGPPVCDQISGQCNCKPYVIGRTCDQCEPGFWNLTSGVGCEACQCDPVGAEGETCNLETGQCLCRNGVVGRKCDICQPYHYGFSVEGCGPCECDVVGSLSLQCDANGQCTCRENVVGRRCDRCKENTYDKQAGCRDCPACYNLVLDAVSEHRERLAELERLLSDIISNPTVLNDEAFEQTLNDVMAEVDKLWKDAQAAAKSGGEATVEQHLKELQERIAKVRSIIQDITNLMRSGELYAKHGEGNITEAELLIENANDALREAQVYLDVEGNRALDKASDLSNQFGQQSARMSEIAREARLLAEKHEDDAKTITQLAYDARNTSNSAHKLAKKAIEDQNNITQVIKGLESEIDGLSNRHKQLLEDAASSLAEARRVKAESLDLSTEVSSIAIPNLNTSGLRDHAIQIEGEAQRLSDLLNKMMDERKDLIKELKIQLKEAEDLKNKGMIQQKETDELLESVLNAKKEAEEAVKKADEILEEAENTLRTLKGFDQKVQESRAAAEEALSRIDEIEQLIIKAETMTEEAENALKGAESNAKSARDIAQTAQETAESASKQAREVRQEADETKDKATSLKKDGNEIATRVVDIQERVDVFEIQAKEDLDTVLSAQEKANAAKSKAEKASERVTEAYDIVTEILHFLDKAVNFDTSELDKLSDKLDEAYRKYEQSNLDETTDELMNARSWQQGQITLYEEELRLLRMEVDNIQEIKESLPDGCFRQARIET